MTFQDCELAILRHAVDESEHLVKKTVANSEEVERMIAILEAFLRRKKLICYGGTAINNILPKDAQFYDRDVEVPDYDFYSSRPMEDAKELADIYHREGYSEVEAKSGMHYGTFKVFVNFIPIADITLLPRPIYQVLSKEAIHIAGIRYCPANFLRMNIYLELSRPMGDVSRWEKLLKRLVLLNKYYPLKVAGCEHVEIQRKLSDGKERKDKDTERKESHMYRVARDALIDQGVVFFGGYANSLYGRYMPTHERRLVENIPDFDVIAEHAGDVAGIVVERLTDEGFRGARVVVRAPIGEMLPAHYEIRVGDETIAFVYEPIACHNFNRIRIQGREVNVATIDTLLSFLLAFYYVDRPYYSQFRDRILCIAQFLFRVQQRNRLEQRGLLKRFSIECYGKQKTVEDIRAEKTAKFRELSGDPGSNEYQMWFLKYVPRDGQRKKTVSSVASSMSAVSADVDTIVNKKKHRMTYTSFRHPYQSLPAFGRPTLRLTVRRRRAGHRKSRRGSSPFPTNWF
jgi:hypothetical protein